MKRIKSIRTQLVVYLVLGVVLLEILAGVGLFAYVQETLEHALDATLAAKADAIASAVHMEDDGQPHLLISPAAAAESTRHEGSFFFQIWRANGQALDRVAPGNDESPLPKSSNPHKRFADVTLPGGIAGRMTQLSFLAQPDEDVYDTHGDRPLKPGEAMILVVAHDRRAIDQPLAVLLTGLSFMAILVTAGILGIVTWGVRRGLRPLAAVVQQVDRIGPASLDVRFPVDSLPLELLPIANKLNDLISRLQSAFARERRFSADIAHELRTPIAELKSLCEITLRWPEGNVAAEAVGESLDIAKQMEATVTALLSLVRCQAGVESPYFEKVDLSLLLDSSWGTFKNEADAKRLVVEQTSTVGCELQTDRKMLTLVLRNLLANAVQHTPPGGHVQIEALRSADTVSLTIGNTNTTLTTTDLPHLFEPFWRKDPARTAHAHEGLGLAIVREYCALLCASLNSSLARSGWFQITLTLPCNPANQSSTTKEPQIAQI